MPRFLLHNRHEPSECAATYASWRGFDSPLRRGSALASCLEGGHAIWWQVEADDADLALGLLPPYVARQTRALAVSEVSIP